ncbi:gp58-like family protein [Clostridioides difficile]|nr:gp58-like family protein [Clostridioides difficile]
MKETSQEYKKAILENSRIISSKIIINNEKYTDEDIISINIEESILNNEKFELGGGIATSVNIEINNYFNKFKDYKFKNKWFDLYFYIEIAINEYQSRTEEVYFGKYYIFETELSGKIIKLECYDTLILTDKAYKPNIGFPATVYDIVVDIANILNLKLSDKIVKRRFNNNDLLIEYKPNSDEATYRQVLIDCAVIAGSFLIVKYGEIEFLDLIETDVQITGNNWFDVTIGSESNQINFVDINGVVAGDPFENGLKLSVLLLDYNKESEIRKVAQSILNKYKNFVYTGFSMDWQGDFGLDVGDKLIIYDKDDIPQATFISDNKINYNGGLSSTVKAKIDKEEVRSASRTVQRLDSNLKKLESGFIQTNESIELYVKEITDKQETLESKFEILSGSIEAIVQSTVDEAVSKIVIDTEKIVMEVTKKIDGEYIVSTINQSAEKIEMSAINIDLEGYVTFNSLEDEGETRINGSNIITDTLAVDKLKSSTDNPIIHLFVNDERGIDCSIDATAQYEEGIGDALRYKRDSENYLCIRENSFSLYQSGYPEYEVFTLGNNANSCFIDTVNGKISFEKDKLYYENAGVKKRILLDGDSTGGGSGGGDSGGEVVNPPADALYIVKNYERLISHMNSDYFNTRKSGSGEWICESLYQTRSSGQSATPYIFFRLDLLKYQKFKLVVIFDIECAYSTGEYSPPSSNWTNTFTPEIQVYIGQTIAKKNLTFDFNTFQRKNVVLELESSGYTSTDIYFYNYLTFYGVVECNIYIKDFWIQSL